MLFFFTSIVNLFLLKFSLFGFDLNISNFYVCALKPWLCAFPFLIIQPSSAPASLDTGTRQCTASTFHPRTSVKYIHTGFNPKLTRDTDCQRMLELFQLAFHALSPSLLAKRGQGHISPICINSKTKYS